MGWVCCWVGVGCYEWNWVGVVGGDGSVSVVG